MAAAAACLPAKGLEGKKKTKYEGSAIFCELRARVADPFDDQGSAAACACSSSAAASKRSSCSGSMVSNTALSAMKEAKGVQFFVKYGNGMSSVCPQSSSLRDVGCTASSC